MAEGPEAPTSYMLCEDRVSKRDRRSRINDGLSL